MHTDIQCIQMLNNNKSNNSKTLCYLWFGGNVKVFLLLCMFKTTSDPSLNLNAVIVHIVFSG